MVNAAKTTYDAGLENVRDVHIWTRVAQNLRVIVENSTFETKAQWAEAAGVSPERLSQYLAGDPRDYRLLERLEEMVVRTGGNPLDLLAISGADVVLGEEEAELARLIATLPSEVRRSLREHVQALASVAPTLTQSDLEALQLKRDLGDKRFFQAVRTAQRMMEIIEQDQTDDPRRSTA